MKGPIQSVEVSYFVQATEDETRIAESVSRALGLDGPPSKEELQGHYGNPILHVRYHIISEGAGAVFKRIVSMLPEEPKEELVRSISEHLDEHNALYLRLDKQLIMDGRFGLSDSDPVRVKVKPRLFLLKQGAPAFYLGAIGA